MSFKCRCDVRFDNFFFYTRTGALELCLHGFFILTFYWMRWFSLLVFAFIPEYCGLFAGNWPSELFFIPTKKIIAEIGQII